MNYLEIHAGQSMPPGNLNRDDTGAPKTMHLFGEAHQYASSQSQKRPMKQHMARQGHDAAILTKKAVELIADRIVADDWTSDTAAAEKEAVALLRKGGIIAAEDKPAKKKAAAGKKTETPEEEQTVTANDLEALLFIAPGQIAAVAALAGTNPSKNQVKAALSSEPTFDQAMFGRMVANDAALNIEAAVQVAPMIYLDPYAPAFDYGTGMDDVTMARGESGAAMIYTVEFSSGVAYRYMVIDLDQLQRNLRGGDHVEAVVRVVDAFLSTLPTGKQNTFANRSLPDTVLLSAGEGAPVNLIEGFRGGDGWDTASASQAMLDRWQRMQRMHRTPPTGALLTTADNLSVPGTVEVLGGYEELLDTVAAMVKDLS